MSKVFVASSLEGRPYAELIADVISGQGADPVLWWSQTAFPLGATLIESLVAIASNVDGAIILMTPDDETVRRGTRSFAPAQNLLLEYGWFAGQLGRSRVAVAAVGDLNIPSDLDGVASLRFPPLLGEEDSDHYKAAELRPQILPWLHMLDVTSCDGARISSLVHRIAQGAKPADRLRIKSRILCEQVDPDDFPRLIPDQLEHLLLKHTNRAQSGQKVGYQHTMSVTSYLDFTELVPDSDEEKALSGHLARYIAELISRGQVAPTVLAISKLASRGILQSATRRLPFPVIMVSPLGPNRDSPIEGFFEPGDRALLLHDVALSGQHLVDCVVTMRSKGLVVNELVTLAQHQSGVGQFSALMRENRIQVHCATILMPDMGRVLCDPMSPTDQSANVLECVLCDVVHEVETTPVRSILSRADLPTEILTASESFALVGDVAPLVPGHVLIVSKRHLISMSKCSGRELVELENFRKHIAQNLTAIYGVPVISFEHGLCNRAKMASCGIDHAHLHMLPIEQPVGEIFREDFQTQALTSLGGLPQATRNQDEYLLLIDEDGACQFTLTDTPTRQYFRRVVSMLTGRELWNWNDQLLVGHSGDARHWLVELHARFGGLAH
ncbi:MAG TPA: TIR domain-containing protein [Actinocrinis sp.]|jgi:diadenosine tetraphosphate (Ap4A) HIT family hydrolase|uniref:TIR domain-containing protein n=1 Tax=Actinocrinis sp. TaxID=1920516 RepID=UPI002DDCFC2F|nr:TIR domain-containing protein [Actinocrinis sp.]HEV3172769.1 TIR domain-containing protein [Actinocrinis sp.]